MFARQSSLPFPSAHPSQATQQRHLGNVRVLSGSVQAKVVRLSAAPKASSKLAGSQLPPVARSAKVVGGPASGPGAMGASTPAGGRPGRRFAAMRRLHAVETFGACMMIVTCLVLALFG